MTKDATFGLPRMRFKRATVSRLAKKPRSPAFEQIEMRVLEPTRKLLGDGTMYPGRGPRGPTDGALRAGRPTIHVGHCSSSA
jgi:hypothetical protein